MKKIVFLIGMFILLFSFPVKVIADEENKFKEAFQYYSTGRYKEAIRLFRDYTKEKPNSTIYYYIGYALYKTRNFEEANKYFKMAYLLDPMFSPTNVISYQKIRRQKSN
jgi:tetratricopeptide (TPR) repeat protein